MLAIENPDEKGLQLAWWNMCQCTQNGDRVYEISAEDYAIAREKAAKANSELRNGMKFSEDHKKNLCGHGKPVINITTGEKYNSSFEAEKITGIRHIGECCRGKRPSAGQDAINGISYVWRFQGEENKDFGYKVFYIHKKVICIETGEIYESIVDAYRKTGIGETTISYDCNNKKRNRTNNRLHFKFYNEEKL